VNSYDAQPGSFLVSQLDDPGDWTKLCGLSCPVDECGWVQEIDLRTLDELEFVALSHLLDAHPK
jgi:hypothetical protein